VRSRPAEDDGGAAVAEHVRQTLRRVAGVEREVGAAGFPHGQQRGDDVGAAAEGQPDDAFRADAEPPQVVGEPVGAFVECLVGEFGAVGDEGDAVGGDELVHAAGRRARQGGSRQGGGVPGGELLALRGGGARQGGQPGVRFGGDGGQQHQQPVGPPLCGGVVEQGGAVLDGAGEDPVDVVEDEPQVELDQDRRRDAGQGDADGRVDGGGGAADVALVVVEQHLEDRGAGAVPLLDQCLDELFEGQVLVGVRTEGDPLDPADELGEGRVAGQVGAQHQGVDEEADELLDLGAVAVGDRGADDDVVLARVLGQQRGVRGEEGHEGGRAGVAGDGAQPGGDGGRHGELDPGAG
jgi:hypothetical protein